MILVKVLLYPGGIRKFEPTHTAEYIDETQEGPMFNSSSRSDSLPLKPRLANKVMLDLPDLERAGKLKSIGSTRINSYSLAVGISKEQSSGQYKQFVKGGIA